jgi:hypothetical protein
VFRFSIRDLLWLTLVVAIALGWLVRERRLRADAERLGERANNWRLVTGGLERVLDAAGWKVKVDFNASEVEITRRSKWAIGEGPFAGDARLAAAFIEPTNAQKE